MDKIEKIASMLEDENSNLSRMIDSKKGGISLVSMIVSGLLSAELQKEVQNNHGKRKTPQELSYKAKRNCIENQSINAITVAKPNQSTTPNVSTVTDCEIAEAITREEAAKRLTLLSRLTRQVAIAIVNH